MPFKTINTERLCRGRPPDLFSNRDGPGRKELLIPDSGFRILKERNQSKVTSLTSTCTGNRYTFKRALARDWIRITCSQATFINKNRDNNRWQAYLNLPQEAGRGRCAMGGVLSVEC